MEAPNEDAPKPIRKLFIGGLNLSTKTEDLRDYFIKYGEITDVVVLTDPHTKKSRGFGFVTYATDEAVQQCLSENPHSLHGREVETKKAIPRTEKDGAESSSLAKSKKVFLGGLSLDATEEEVHMVAQEFGEIEEVVIITDKETKKPRGFGFVVFKDYDSADRMCKKRFMDIHNREVEAKKAISLEDMKRAEEKARRDHDRVRGHVRDRGGYRSRDDDYGDGRDYRSQARYSSYDYPPRDYPPRSYSPPRYSGGYDERSAYPPRPPPNQYDHAYQGASYGSGYGGYGGYNGGSGGYGGGSGGYAGGSGGYASGSGGYGSGSGGYGGGSGGYGGGSSNSGGYSSGLLPPPSAGGYGGGYNEGAGYGSRNYPDTNSARYHPYKR